MATKRISSKTQKLQRKQIQRNLGLGRFKQRILQRERKAQLAVKRIMLNMGEEVRDLGLKSEPLKPGRFSDFYLHAKGAKLPMRFMSMAEERIRGSTPGDFISDWVTTHHIDLKTIDRQTPQIRLIPKTEISDYLLQRFEPISTEEKRQKIERLPVLKQRVIQFARNELATVDWAEQTHGIRINVNPEILAWVGKIKK